MGAWTGLQAEKWRCYLSTTHGNGKAEQEAEGRRKEMVMMAELGVGGALQVLGLLARRR